MVQACGVDVDDSSPIQLLKFSAGYKSFLKKGNPELDAGAWEEPSSPSILDIFVDLDVESTGAAAVCARGPYIYMIYVYIYDIIYIYI